MHGIFLQSLGKESANVSEKRKQTPILVGKVCSFATKSMENCFLIG